MKKLKGNYRIIKRDGEYFLSMVFYDENGNIHTIGAQVKARSLEDIKEKMELMSEAFDYPVITIDM